MPPLPQQVNLPVPQNTAGAPQQAPPVASGQPAPGPMQTPEVQNLQKVGADPVVGILRPLQIAPEMKANIYKTYQGAKSQEDFINAFRGLDAPPEVKASLYKLRFAPPVSDLQGAQQAIAQAEQQRNSPFMTSQFERDRDFQTPFPQAIQTGLEMANKAVQAPVQMGQWLGNQMGNFAETMSSMQPQTPGSVTQERVPEQYRHAGSGAMRGAAGLVGETFGNPTNWPFLAGAEARPLIQKALSMGFAGQMGYGTVQSLQNLYQNWDQMSPADRTEELTKAGFGAYFTKESAQHGFEGTLPTTREQATQTGAAPSQREVTPTNPTAQAPRPAPVQVAPRQPSPTGAEAAPPAQGQLGTSTAGQTQARDVGGQSARARLTAALEKRPGAPTPVQQAPQAATPAQPNEPVRGPAAAEAPAGAARKPVSAPAVGALEGVRSQQIEAGRKQLIDRKVDPVMMGQKLGLVYDGYAGGIHSFRDTVKGGGVSVSDVKFSEETLRQRAEEHRGSIKSEQLSPVVQAKPERARAELEQTRPEPTYTKVPSKGRSLDESKEIVARGEPKPPRKTGSDEAYRTSQQEHAKSRNEYLAAKAQIAREETAPQAVAEGKKTQHPVQTEITRFLKTPGRTGKEIADAIDRVAPEERSGLADEMKKRAERAEATVKHVKEMSEAKDFDNYLKQKLSEGAMLGKRFVAGKGEKTSFAPGGGEFKPKFVREHPEELASFWNMLRGREMREVKGVDERGRKLKDLTKHPEVKERVDGAMKDLDAVLKEIKSQGGKWTEEQAKRGQDAFALISAGTGKKFIAGKFAEPTIGPSGEPRAEGTAQTRAWMNAVMGRARTSNLSKPSPEEFSRRIEYLEREAKVSRLAEEHLRGTAKEAPAKAPEKPQERPKPAPKAAPQAKAETAPKPKPAPKKTIVESPKAEAKPEPKVAPEGPHKLSADEQTELRELRDLKAGMAGPLDAHELVKVNDRIRELEGTKLPSEKPKPKSTAPDYAKVLPEKEAEGLQKRAKEIRNKLFGYDKHISDLREVLKRAKSPGDRASLEQDLQQAIFNRARYRKEVGYHKDAATGKVSYASIEDARKALGAPEEKVSETEVTQREQLRELDSRIKALERSGEYEPTLKRLKETYEELTGKVRPADASDFVELAKREEKAAKKAEGPKREFIDPKAADAPITIKAEQESVKAIGPHGESLLEAIAKGGGDVEKALSLYEKTRPGSGYREAYDRIARPILESLGKGDLETLDATRRYERALEIYNAGIKAKSPQALGKALEYAKTGRIAKAGESEKGALSFGGLKGKSPSFGKAVKDWYGRMKESAAANREARNLSDRVADLRQQSKGDILVYGEISKHLKPEKPATFYREMYDWAEQKLLPKDKQTITPTPEMEKRFHEEVEPIVKENTRIINKLRSAGYAIKDIAGLMHRVPLGKGQSVEKIVEERMKVGSGNVLSTFASSRKGAKYGIMTDPQTGQRHVVRVRQNGKVYVWDGGQQLGGSIGLKSEFENEGFKFGRGTTKEISDATGKQYYRHAWINNAVENLALRRAERIHDFMENIKQEPEFKRLSTRSKDVRDALGYRAPKVTNAEWIPQLKGYYFEPHIAEVLEREWGRFQKGEFSAYERMSNWMKRSIFWNPLIHVPNIGVHWFGEKGLTGEARLLFRPSEYRALGKAWKTMTDPVEYSKMLDAGLPLMRQPNTHDVTKLFLAKTIDQVATTKIGGPLAKAFGYANPIQLAKALYRGSSEITWGVHDLAILQSTFARMEQHGWDLQTASREVTKHIPNYRMPPRVWNNRTIGKIMDAPGLSMFSQYHYGAFKSYGEMVRELVHPEKPGDRMRAIDRMAALGLMMYVLYPQLDKLGKALTGDQNATFRRAGSATFPYNVAKLARGIGALKGKGPQMGVLPFAESVVTPAPIISAGIKAAQSKELTKPGQKPSAVAKKIGQIGLETVGPIAGFESGQKTPGKGRFDWKTFLFRMAGGRFERPITKGAGARLATLPKK